MSLFDSASVVITPSGYKEDKLYSIKPTDGSGDLVVTRATTATRVNSDGLIEQVPYNLLQQSNTFNVTWGAAFATVTGGQAGFDGTNNAWLLSKSASGGRTGQSVTLSSSTYTYSIYAKAGTDNFILLRIDGVSIRQAYFDLQNGTIGTATLCTPTIESVGNGWYRCTITYTDTTTIVRIYVADADNDTSGSSGSVYIQNAQLVTGTSAKEYFPTTDRLDVPRLDYTNSTCPSILVEPQRTNLALYSEQFDNAYWLKGNTTVTANQTISPDGTQNADTLLATSGMTSLLYRSFTLTSGTPYTFSIYVKKKTITALGNRFRINFVNNLFVNFNGSVPVITGGSGIIENAGNGFYRIITTVTPSVTSNTLYIYPDGNNNNADEYYIWGAQLEAGSNATSYIPTIASSVTRNADVISKTGISSLIGQTEGTIYAEINNTLRTYQEGYLIRLFADANNEVWIRKEGGTNTYSARFRANSVNVYTKLDINVLNGNNKIAFAYKSGDLAIYLNGIQIGTSSSTGAFSATVGDLNLGYTSTAFFNDRIKSAIVWKTRLSNTELAQLTTI